MDLVLQWCFMVFSSTMIVRLALAERARLAARLAPARVPVAPMPVGDYAVRR